ncbi:universal stress protein [Roseivirga sp.]|uniref:universal stress protein n=1 Tax=Roseivirga sp. TaxID=1964215 RepID=UPI003B51EEF2
MKPRKILVPIDFSACSLKALNEAVRLARAWNARLIIMNACQKPAAYSDASVTAYSRDLIREAESNAQLAFDRISESVTDLSHTDYTFVVKHAFPQDAIISLAIMEEVDLLVMGTTGASGFKGRLMGSNTYKVSKNVECPVLAIPEKAEPGKGFREIALAGDYKDTDTKEVFNLLTELVKFDKAVIHVLHISDVPSINEEESTEAKILNRYLKGLRHYFHFRLDDEIDQGINEFIAEKDIDLLTLVARKHKLLDRIFNSSVTRKMAYHARVPLLILHAK